MPGRYELPRKRETPPPLRLTFRDHCLIWGTILGYGSLLVIVIAVVVYSAAHNRILPSNFDLPDYPQAKRLDGYQIVHGGEYQSNFTTEVHFTFQVDETPPEKIFSYYRRRLPETGWQERGTIIYEEKGELLRFAGRGAHLLEIRVSHLKNLPSETAFVNLTLL
jgi:hypothetical protein